jgi:hypothetical protein
LAFGAALEGAAVSAGFTLVFSLVAAFGLDLSLGLSEDGFGFDME